MAKSAVLPLKILLADADASFRQELYELLSREAYQVRLAGDGISGWELAQEWLPDLLLICMSLPGKDAISLTLQVREHPKLQQAYIFILSEHTEEYVQVSAYGSGADFFLPKPVKYRALLRRINLLQKRLDTRPDDRLYYRDLQLDKRWHLVYKGDRAIYLPRKEFSLLWLLIYHAGQVWSRDRILQQVWGNDHRVDERTVDVHVRKIRAKIGDEYIRTVKGVGYKTDRPG
jgi:two-component system, OmpR family, alkaline phosphatase synthesis response regulator PhoP